MSFSSQSVNVVESPMVPTPKQILDQLPQRPKQILVWGAVDPSWETEGAQSDYAPFAPSHKWAQTPSLQRCGLLEAELPQIENGTSWDLVVINRVTPDVHPLTLWDELAQRLIAGAIVVLFVDQSTAARMPNWLNYVQTIGLRCGFERLKHAANNQESASTECLAQVFCKTEVPPRWTIRHVRARDVPGISQLFSDVFEQTLSQEMWQWKYGCGHGNAVIATRGGKVIAHYGGMYRDILIDGVHEWAFQICDVMVHPNERGVMTRQGPFLLTAATGAEIYGPYGFGFPNARAMQIAEKMGLYAPVGSMVTVTWSAGATRFRFGTRLCILYPNSKRHKLHVERLWKQMSSDLSDAVVGYRDWAYIQRRYLAHPQYRYEVIAVISRLTNRPLGVLVLRKFEDSVELMDIVAATRNLPALIDQARRLAGLWGKSTIYCWITKNQARHFMVHGAKASDLDVSIPTSVWTKDARARVFENKWWLMSGDTDFR